MVRLCRVGDGDVAHHSLHPVVFVEVGLHVHVSAQRYGERILAHAQSHQVYPLHVCGQRECCKALAALSEVPVHVNVTVQVLSVRITVNCEL